MILLNDQLTNVAVILEARMLHDVYICFEFEICGAKNETGRTYGVDIVGVTPAQLIERIKKLRHRPLSSNVSLSRRLKDVTHVHVYGFPAETG